MAVATLDVNRAYSLAGLSDSMSEEDIDYFQWMRQRLLQLEPEQARFAILSDRWDNLYYPNSITKGGPSHWADHPSANVPGRSHVSVNSYPSYVDIPAAMQAVPPIENFVSQEDDASRMLASLAERAYRAWLEDEGFNAKVHKACVVKGLYGKTAIKVFWNEALGRVATSVVEQPRNLRIGYSSSDYTKPSWATYVYRITPETAEEDWGLNVQVGRDTTTGEYYPYIIGDAQTLSARSWLSSPSEMSLEVYDYWYRERAENASVELGKPTKYETWNAIYVGNAQVKRKRHPEYGGRLPYLPLFNTYIPGVPDGRSEFYDIEQLVREKDERMTEAAQMMSRAINGQMWQLVGPESPDVVPASAMPQPNRVVGPGAGNRIEKVEPWMPAFQVETHLTRIDRELADVSGLSDLLRGLASSAVLSSSKAISALIANYEARLSMKRDLLYEWRRDAVDLIFEVWASKNSELKPIIRSGFRHEIIPPSLTPRDDMEAAQMALNLSAGKLWSQVRAMDRVGVDDPEAEQDLIRIERTDATLFPADVQVQAALLATLAQTKAMQQQMAAAPPGAPGGPPPGTPGAPPPAQEQAQMAGMAAMMAQGGGQEAMAGMQGPEEQPLGGPPPVNTPEGAANATPSQLLGQFQIQEGEASNRLLGQQTLQKTEEET